MVCLVFWLVVGLCCGWVLCGLILENLYVVVIYLLLGLVLVGYSCVVCVRSVVIVGSVRVLF